MCHACKNKPTVQNPYASRALHPDRREIIKSRQQFVYCVKRAQSQFPKLANKISPQYTSTQGAWDRNKRNSDILARFNEVARLLVTNYACHYVAWSIESAGKVAYSPDNVHRHDSKRRRKTTLARYIGRQLKTVKLSGHELDTICRAILRYTLIGTADFTILRGDDIVDAYTKRVGGNSCMTDTCADYVQVYAENPDVVGLLVYSDNESGQQARALVWDCDCGEKYLDRIYPNSGNHVDAIEEWGNRNGYVCREHQSAGHGHGNYSVTLDSPSNNLWPYMDTFAYTDDASDDSQVTLSTSCGSTCLDSTSGEFGDYGAEQCSCCGNRYDSESGAYLERYDIAVCDGCLQSFIYCDCVNEYCDEGDVVQSTCGEYSPEDYACDNWHRCEACGDWHTDLDDMLYCPSGYIYCNDCWSERFDECEECGDVFELDSLNGDCLCENCELDQEQEQEQSKETREQLEFEARDHKDRYAITPLVVPASDKAQLALPCIGDSRTADATDHLYAIAQGGTQ